jgi:cell division transport system permease protein
LLQGLAGGVLSLAVVSAGLWLLNREVQTLAESYGSAYRLPFLAWGDMAAIVLFAGLIGWLGAYLSVNRHLRDMEPG